jgi:ketosteroid isomerase-like protein
MVWEEEAREIASHWVQAWNAHDLDRIMSHYEENVVLISPVAAKILDDRHGIGEDRVTVLFPARA